MAPEPDMATDPPITAAAIREARARLPAEVAPSPLLRAPWLDRYAGDAEVWLKDETWGPTGAFKIRGAINAVAALPADARARGVVTASTGNHGRALAWAASAQGVRAVVCLSRLVPQNKVDAVRAAGGEVHVVGASQDEAGEEVERLAREEGLTPIPPFDHADIVAGQGTIGLEIAETLPAVGSVLVGLSGGGLAGGLALGLKSVCPDARVVGISPDNGGAAMHASIRAGQPVDVPEPPSLADSLGGGIGLDNRYTFALCRQLVDDIVLLSEAAIAAGMRALYRQQGLVAEGGGAVGPAALLAGRIPAPKGPVVCIISGAGVDPDLFAAVLDGADALPPTGGNA